MKQIIRVSAVAGLLIAGTLAVRGAADEPVPAKANVPWKVTGQLEEACSCRPPCPCWFKSLPSRMTCDGAQIILISEGHYGPTPLAGLAVAEFVQSPEGKSMFESFGNWNIDNVYIDEKANAEQREALKDLAAHFFPPAAKKREFKYVPITRQIDGQEHITTVGEYGVCAGHLIEGGYSGAPKIVNPPLADPTHREYAQGESTKLTYSDAGQGWKYDHSNYMFNSFTVDNVQYEKYEAEMAKKMAQMKPAAGQ
jgi:hypothetical protein